MMLTSFRGLSLHLAAWLASVTLGALAAVAAEGRAQDWQLGFQPPATAVAEQMHGFHDLVLVIIIVIVVFVTGLLAWVMLRYNEKANPVPSKNAHNTTIEVAWTIIPVLILLVIAIPSFRLLYAQYDVPKADLTIKVIGHQWYWSYAYPDHGGFGFDANVANEDLANPNPKAPYLIAADNDVVVPVNKVVHLLITSDDVIHDWAMPAFGTKIDAVKGRNTLAWFQVTETGTYYGQCSELCGARHAFMPITVRVVSDEEFAAWVAQAKTKFTASIPEPVKTAGRAGNGGKAASGQGTLTVAENVD